MEKLMKLFVVLLMLAAIPALAQERKSDSVLYIVGADIRFTGANKLELMFQSIVPHKLGYQVKFGYGNMIYESATVKGDYSGTISVGAGVKAYTVKLGLIPLKIYSRNRSYLALILNGCAAFTDYYIDVTYNDAVYGLVTDHHSESKIYPGFEGELHYGLRLGDRFYFNLALVTGVKSRTRLFDGVVQNTGYGNVMPGQGASAHSYLYSNLLVGMSINLYKIASLGL